MRTVAYETSAPTLFRLRVDVLLAGLDRLTSPASAHESRPGFNLESLMQVYMGEHYAAPTSHYGRITTALASLNYWVFVNQGDPIAIHPPGLWPKCVRLLDLYEDLHEVDTGRGAFAVTAGGPPAIVPAPLLPEDLMPGNVPSFERSRDALLEFCQECVERVNLVVPSALALARKAP